MKSGVIFRMLLVVALVSTSAWAADPNRLLTTSSTVGGTVTTPGIGTYSYDACSVASIVATVEIGYSYHFVNWTGTAVTAGKVANPGLPSTTVTMDADYTVQANFAIWGPSGDSSLVFNLNFEITKPGPPPEANALCRHPTTGAPFQLVGDLNDYNAINYGVWQPGKPGLGTDANFGQAFDKAPSRPNDCKFQMQINYPNSKFLNLGNDNGADVHDKRAITFWFNVSDLTDGTFIRCENYDLVTNPDYWWEVRIYQGKLDFHHHRNLLRMETVSTLAAMGIQANMWHHAAVVINRTTETSSKMYIDGLEVPVVVTYQDIGDMGVAFTGDPYSMLWVGAGEREFEGLLDEILLFYSELTPLQVSILNQLDGTEKPIALDPIPRSSDVIIDTNLVWAPDPCATRQTLYFDDDNDVCSVPLYSVSDDGNDMNSVTNAQMGIGLLDFNTTYYWAVDTNVNGTMIKGPVWSFTTETGKAVNISPVDGAEDVNDGNVNLVWTTRTPGLYDVYFSDDSGRVDANDPNFRHRHAISEFNDVCSAPVRGTTYYWRIDTNYPTKNNTVIQGDRWSFTTRAYELVFNTRDGNTMYADHNFAPYACDLHTVGWKHVATGYLASDGVVVFDFNDGNDFSYDHRYDIVVVPTYRGKDVADGNNNIVIRPIAIHVDGNFYFDGRMDISGDDTPISTDDDQRARCGGFPPPRHNSGTTAEAPDKYCWSSVFVPADYYNRFGTNSSDKYIYIPNEYGQSIFGPGIGVNPPYKGGGGGGYGGVGGDCGRGYFHGIFSGGPSYGDKEVPVPFGGSAGGWASDAPGSAGGGGIEIYTTGNVTIDGNSQILAKGGSQLYSSTNQPSGGGAGGSVRIIADGNVTIKGVINVNGGKGGDTTKQGNECGGGGAGGRVAIFYGGNYTKSGQITADGGPKGIYEGAGQGSGDPNGSLAEDGQDGTIYEIKSSPARRTASAPTPKNGYRMFYSPCPNCPNSAPCPNCPNLPNKLTLKWYSGFNKTDACDVAYFGTSPATMLPIGMVSATRGQHSSPNDVNIVAGNTYFWKVKTIAADGNADSNLWSFTTVYWQCKIAAPTDGLHIVGPRWDSNRDCVLNDEDFAYFAKDWRIPRISGSQNYTLDHTYGGALPDDGIVSDLDRFIREWLDCIGRTNDGCKDW